MKKSESNSLISKLQPSDTNSVSRFQKFQTQTIPRSKIKNAEYNPRSISKEARRRLKKAIQERGLVEGLIWNERTGNLVGGHQRLSILDDLEKGTNYSLTVCRIDVDEKEEKRLNILLNNPLAQGAYESESLEKLIRDIDLDIDSIGFDRVDIAAICTSDSFADLFSEEKEPAKKEIGELEAMKERRKKAKEENQSLDDAEFYCVLVFKDRSELDSFLKATDESMDRRYIDGARFAKKMGLKINAEPQEPGRA